MKEALVALILRALHATGFLAAGDVDQANIVSAAGDGQRLAVGREDQCRVVAVRVIDGVQFLAGLDLPDSYAREVGGRHELAIG